MEGKDNKKMKYERKKGDFQNNFSLASGPNMLNNLLIFK